MHCPRCDSETPEGVGACPRCGTDLRDIAEAQTADPTTPAPSAKMSRTLLLAVLGVAGIVAVGGIGAGVFLVSRRSDGTANPAASNAASSTALQTATPSAQLTYSAAEEAVTLFYEAIASGDIGQVRATMTKAAGPSVSATMFEGWDSSFSFRVLGSDVKGPKALVDVQELAGGGLAGGVVRFLLIDEGGAWKVQAWESAAAANVQTGSGGGTAGPALTQESAADVVGRMLDALMGDRVAEVRSLVSPRYLREDPTFARPSSGALLRFAVVKAEKKDETFVVTAKEEWVSGPETVLYTVAIVGDKLMVDGVDWP